MRSSMGQKVTLGGDRLGSGKKMQAELHNYFRSTHNLSEKWASTMGCGILYPAMVKLGMRGDSFDIDINADCRTIPTQGPLFGSFKMQVDVFQCPIRLYQGILHNNPLAIGLNMAQVKFPKLVVKTKTIAGDGMANAKFAENCLLKYLGMSGLGSSTQWQSEGIIGRKINALPALSYYDVFKTYYANKQEDNAYVISNEKIEVNQDAKYFYLKDGDEDVMKYQVGNTVELGDTAVRKTIKFSADYKDLKSYRGLNDSVFKTQYTYNTNVTGFDIAFSDFNPIKDGYSRIENSTDGSKLIAEWDEKNNRISVYFTVYASTTNITVEWLENELFKYEYGNVKLLPFTLTNIDDMRYDLLSHNRLGQTFEISSEQDGQGKYLPYEVLISQDGNDDTTLNTAPLNGLVVKTYQNDIFNNWLNTDWIEGENGINELTKVAIVDGAFSMDSLNFATKLYNMLNRIAVAGGTYEDWQDVVYETAKRRQIESPIFVGGISQEVVFDEIVQTTPSDAGGENSVLGTLGGRGRLSNNKKGGKIHVKCDEACFIIAIVSLTPRTFQTQGNEFYMTELDSMDDLHKPAMDGIGFQDLIGERMAWWDTKIVPNTSIPYHRSKIGKLPAWIEYMTSVDKAFGDFANEINGYMILNRRYEFDEVTKGIKDATTYIDPAKYNYAFAVQDLTAQNFWVEIEFDIKARRLMSARLIPSV